MFNKRKEEEVDNQKETAIQNIKIVTTHTLPGKEIKEVLGLVRVLSEAGGKSGITHYNDIGKVEEGVDILFRKLAEKAYETGANAVLNVRLQLLYTSLVSPALPIIVAYGTAVKV